MIFLIVTTCTLLNGECVTRQWQRFEGNGTLPHQCMIAGQIEVKAWSQQHRDWSVKKWRCEYRKIDLAQF